MSAFLKPRVLGPILALVLAAVASQSEYASELKDAICQCPSAE